jgi:uncharacterized repeat protein (TIGR01451 family)
VSVVEGDTQFSGDTMRFGPDTATLGQDNFRLWGPNNPITNFFASQINGDDGLLDKAGTFGSRNNSFTAPLFAGGRQSWDITNVDASAQLTRKQTIAFAQGTTNQDQFSINALGLQIDVGAPRFAFDGATTANRETAVLGDTLTYTVRLDNGSGQADAASVVFKVPLPAGTSFVSGSFTLDGTKPSGANPVTGVTIGTVAVGNVRTVTFQLHVDAIPTPPAPAEIDVAPTWSYTFVSCAGSRRNPAPSRPTRRSRASRGSMRPKR